jgi:hypothetical protein
LISVPAGTEMFQFSAFALPSLCIQPGVTLAGRVSPFGHLRINARLPAPRSFSQATTPFIACDRQGIHHTHLPSLDPITMNTLLGRPRCAPPRDHGPFNRGLEPALRADQTWCVCPPAERELKKRELHGQTRCNHNPDPNPPGARRVASPPSKQARVL